MTTTESKPPAHDASDLVRPAENSRKETSSKLKLAWASYGEVLDATKHQDDKIGQLLTSVAFLTAATIALAALEPTRVLARRFSIPPFNVPLGLVTLTVFLTGIAFSVMLLITSMATPLRLPGLGRTARSGPRQSRSKDLRVSSQIYFFEIAKFSRDEWERKWAVPAEQLETERLSSLIKETHNLGVRTSSKYDRTNEAVSVLSISLLAFALSVVFVGIVATSGGSHPIVLSLWQRCIVAVILGGYCWVQLLTRVRYERPAVEDVKPSSVDSTDRRRYLGQLGYAGAVPLMLGFLIIYEAPEPMLAWILSLLLSAAISVVAFWHAAAPDQRDGRSEAMVRRVVVISLTVIFTAASIATATAAWYGWQLVIASGVVFLLFCQSVIAPSLSARVSRQSYWRANIQKPTKQDGSAAHP